MRRAWSDPTSSPNWPVEPPDGLDRVGRRGRRSGGAGTSPASAFWSKAIAEFRAKAHLRFHSSAVGRGSVRLVSGALAWRWPGWPAR